MRNHNIQSHRAQQIRWGGNFLGETGKKSDSERALCVQYYKMVARWQRYVALSYYLVFWTIFERHPKNSPRHRSPAPAPRRIRRWRSLPRAHRLRVAVAVDGGDDAGAGGALAPAPPSLALPCLALPCLALPCLAAAVKLSRHPPPAPSSSSFSHTPPPRLLTRRLLRR